MECCGEIELGMFGGGGSRGGGIFDKGVEVIGKEFDWRGSLVCN